MRPLSPGRPNASWRPSPSSNWNCACAPGQEARRGRRRRRRAVVAAAPIMASVSDRRELLAVVGVGVRIAPRDACGGSGDLCAVGAIVGGSGWCGGGL